VDEREGVVKEGYDKRGANNTVRNGEGTEPGRRAAHTKRQGIGARETGLEGGESKELAWPRAWARGHTGVEKRGQNCMRKRSLVLRSKGDAEYMKAGLLLGGGVWTWVGRPTPVVDFNTVTQVGEGKKNVEVIYTVGRTVTMTTTALGGRCWEAKGSRKVAANWGGHTRGRETNGSRRQATCPWIHPGRVDGGRGWEKKRPRHQGNRWTTKSHKAGSGKRTEKGQDLQRFLE